MHKKYTTYLICGTLLLQLTACQIQTQPVSNTTIPTETVAQVQQNTYQSLQKSEGDILAVNLEATPSETEAPFFYIEVSQDVEATLSFDFTKTEGNANIGYYVQGNTEKISIPLDFSVVTKEVSNELTVPLKKGMNVFYMTGDGCQCSLRCELSDIDMEKILFADTLPLSPSTTETTDNI